MPYARMPLCPGDRTQTNGPSLLDGPLTHQTKPLADARDRHLDHAARRADLHFVAYALAEQGAADGRFVADHALGRAGLSGADDRVIHVLAFGGLDADLGAELNAVGVVRRFF